MLLLALVLVKWSWAALPLAELLTSPCRLSLIIAGSITVLNMMYKKLGKWLTTFERHDTWQSYRFVVMHGFRNSWLM